MSTITNIPVHLILPGDNDRKSFNRQSLEDLAASIKQHGLAQPITVRPGVGGFQIVAGERRFRAISEILRWDTCPAIVRDLSDEDASAIMLAENTGRIDLNPIEEAHGYDKRIRQFGWSIERIAQTAGVSADQVKRRLTLLGLSPAVQTLVAIDGIPLGHAEAMAKLDSNRQLIALRIMQEGGNPSLSIFRGIVNRLFEEQAQDTLIDLSTFYIEQLKLQANLPTRGKAAITGAPTRSDLPTVSFVSSDNTASVIDRWISSLLRMDMTSEASVVGTLYSALVRGNFLSVPPHAILVSEVTS